MLEGGREKFLVFAHHKLVLDHITAELEKKVRNTCRCIIRGGGKTPLWNTMNTHQLQKMKVNALWW